MEEVQYDECPDSAFVRFLYREAILPLYWRAMKSLRRVLVVILWIAALSVVIAWFAASSLMAPSQHKVNAPPRDLPCEVVHFASASGSEIQGWFVPTPEARKAVLLLHGSGGDRTSMLSYARFLRKAGYACLMIDFRCHGESLGNQRTFGWSESKDAIASVAWLRKQIPGAKVAVIGTSLGGASALLAKEDLHADAVVAQSVYGDLRAAIWNRLDMRVGAVVADAISCLLTCQVPMRKGLNVDEVSPIKAAAHCTCPLFVIHGTEDHHAHLDEGRRIFDACPNAQKEWWEIKGAAHVDLWTFAGAEYEKRVLAFLNKTML